jgi:2-haloacid dehalogenase
MSAPAPAEASAAASAAPAPASAPESLDLGRYEILTFDCYGTLIDWETGILDALRPLLGSTGAAVTDDDLLAQFARQESAVESESYRRYREVLAEVARRIAAVYRVPVVDGDLDRFAGSVADWPPFPDSAAALASLASVYRLGVLTNCDDDLFAASAARLGARFDPVVTAQQVGSYKPSMRNFEVLLERVGVPPDRVLHVAQSLYHDHVPAGRLGLATVWVDRRAGREGSGATPPADAAPDLVVPDMETLARLAGGTPPPGGRGGS